MQIYTMTAMTVPACQLRNGDRLGADQSLMISWGNMVGANDRMRQVLESIHGVPFTGYLIAGIDQPFMDRAEAAVDIYRPV